MIQNNARISDLKGLVFYEQDIVYDDHIYTEDMDIIIGLDYISPGFGIALMNSEGLPLGEQKETYLFKVGHREVSIYYKNTVEQKRVKMAASVYQSPIMDAKMRLVKSGKVIQLYFQDMASPLIEYTMPIHWDRYSIGFYSNAGNIIKNIETAASVPNYWTLNMYNTDGGYIKFLKNGFTFISCKDKAEIEQPRIQLKAGTYHLQYDKAEYNKKFDIEAFVFESYDSKIKDENKNLLTNGSFTLDTDKEITIKFKGKNGTISNINLSEKEQVNYVPTTGDEGVISLGSYIKLNTKDLSKIWWIGKIDDIPEISEDDFTNKNKEFFVAGTLDERFYWHESSLLKDTYYNFVYNVDNYTLTVSTDDEDDSFVSSKSFKMSSNEFTIFKNVDAIIKKLCIMQTGESEWIDLIATNSSKKYVTTDISSPIIVADTENIPLDISSSYRYWNLSNGKRHYEFTNWEREIFEVSTYVALDKLAAEEPGSIVAYGIYKGAEVDQTRFYETNGKDINDIDPFTKHNERIYNNLIRFIDYAKGEIYFESDVLDRYDYIVIDYLKKDSYAINLRANLSLYEVDISAENKETVMMYDKPIEENGTLQSNNVIHLEKITNFRPSDASYIVLRKEGYYESLSRQSSDIANEVNPS